MSYVSRLLRYYPQFNEHYVVYELPMDKGWALLGAAIENDGWLQFAGLKRDGKAYLGQEIEQLMAKAKVVYAEQRT